MAFPKYDRKTLFEFARVTMKNRLEVDVSPGTLWYKLAETWTEALVSLSGYQQHIAKQLLPETAEAEALARHARIRGLTHKKARQAEGTVSIELTAE